MRAVLFRVEGLPLDKQAVVRAEDFPDYPPETVVYHFDLLEQAGLVFASIQKHNHNRRVGLVFDLTWQGHEFLDAIRRETVWQKIQGRIKHDGASMPFELIKAAAIQLVREVMSL
jgi:DNA-binding PadR family transcriptional regulator